jgi:hypothetical protein
MSWDMVSTISWNRTPQRPLRFEFAIADRAAIALGARIAVCSRVLVAAPQVRGSGGFEPSPITSTLSCFSFLGQLNPHSLDLGSCSAG